MVSSEKAEGETEADRDGSASVSVCSIIYFQHVRENYMRQKRRRAKRIKTDFRHKCNIRALETNTFLPLLFSLPLKHVETDKKALKDK